MVALITGASRGIGRGCALEFAKRGYDIALVYAGNHNAAQATQQAVSALGVRTFCCACDVSDFEGVGALTARVLEELGPIRVLVNNAGVTADNLLLKMSETDFDRVLDINLKGAFNFIKHSYSHFMKQRDGRIINISSVIGQMGNPGQANYAASKAGLIGLTKSVARELASRGVTCNAIAPGYIETDMTTTMTGQAREAMTSAIPMKRVGTVSDVASAAAFLASAEAGYITGQVLSVNGGLYM
ncbi:MAG: 3-oxoacyl-[acyl-carrier-protein] reductase [Clostridiales bacterium]|nr:3-oxoacyl-[acyl-carrier-protein] reductase [Clostridiales bacterium]